MQRFVIVAVEQHEVARAQQGSGNDLVRRARAIQDKIGLIGAEHGRRKTLRLNRRPLMNEKVAEVDIGIAEIITKDPLTEMLEEKLAGRRLAKKLTTLVARTIKGDIGLAIIGHEAAEEGRQQPTAIADHAAHHLLSIEGRRLMTEIDIASDLAGQAQNGHVRKAVSISQSPERRMKADRTNGRGQAPSRLEALPIDHGNIGTDGSVLGNIAIEAAANLNLKILGAQDVQKLGSVSVGFIDNRNNSEQPMKGNRNSRRFHIARNHGLLPSSDAVHEIAPRVPA